MRLKRYILSTCRWCPRLLSPDSLSFGPIHGDTAQHKWNRSRFAGVVSGIAHCGNCIGVPAIGGEV